MKHHPATSIASACLLGAVAQLAPAADATPELQSVEVSATRLRSVADIDVPASITTVHVDADSNRNQANVTELLGGLPGVTALDRQNYAQDTQLSIRGNGSRATFGVRGLRLYVDGIPASMPDGQGQLSHVNVLGADTVQVMRGPFSALYGNSSGGVVQTWSSRGTADVSARARATYGSYGTKSFGAQGLGTAGPVDYNLSLSRFETDGYRDHAAARRDSANLRLGVDVGDNRKLTFVANYLDIPEAQDTLGLTPVDWRADPKQATPVAEQFNTRKSVEQFQGGAVFEQKLGDHTLRATTYAGNRQVTQYLAIPPTTQNNALHSGGVVDLDSDFRGLDLRWSWAGEFIGRRVEFTVGTNYDLQDQLRRGYLNYTGPANNSCTGATTCGVRGTLRRNEDDKVWNFDQFAQGWWQFADRWSVLAGVRHSRVKFDSADHYIVGTNQDDSGSKGYGDTTVVAGVQFHPVESLRLYASTGDGFETPTFNELAYRVDNQPGFAFNLKPERTHNYEIGMKWRPAGGASLDLAMFRGDTRDELVVLRNSGGRSSYGNVDRSRRDGLELSGVLPLPFRLQLDGSYTLVDAQFRSGFSVCPGTPCTTTQPVASGSRISGVPRHQGKVRLSWAPASWNVAMELVASSTIVVTDAGDWAATQAAIQTDHAPGYGVVNADIGYDWRLEHNQLRSFVRVENLFDRRYVGSVIVNEANNRFFESGPGRTLMAGVQWSWR
jgi:iron complex outermembrane receptor protein